MPVALLMAYDGTDFRGYQRQLPRFEPTVQGMLERALRKLCGVDIVTTAAGRTDAGVHAQGQVVTFDPPDSARLTPADWERALNALLPASIVIHAALVVPTGINARSSAIARMYRYRVLRSTRRDPFRERYTHRVRWPLDVSAMQTSCQALLGAHDFAGFGHSPSDQARQPKRTTVRMMHRAVITVHDDELWCEFTANAFLTGMVRRLMGTLLFVGTGRMQSADVTTILAEWQDDYHGPSAPPNGLCLMQVLYPPGTIAWPAEKPME